MICLEQGLDLRRQGSGDIWIADSEMPFLGKVESTIAVGHGSAGLKVTFAFSNDVPLVVLSSPFRQRQFHFGLAVSEVHRQRNQLQGFLLSP